MKKKKLLTEVFVLFFIAAVFVAVYVVIEMGNDWLAVLGGAAVLLIAAYLLMDYLFETKEADRSNDNSVNQRLDELEEVQKAIYTAMKRGNSENAELLRSLEQYLAVMTQAMQQLSSDEVLQNGKSVLEAVKGMRQDYQVGVKNLIKYEKENAKQIAETAHNNTEMTIVELDAKFAKVMELLEEQRNQLEFLRLSTMTAPFTAHRMDEDSEDDDGEILPVLSDAVEPKEVSEPEIREDEFDAEAAIKAYMAEQGFDVEDDEEAVEEIPVPAEPEEAPRMSEEEIASTLQSMVGEDPNRALTPEEIAAMFAAIQ